jgi:hypothetical protein
VGRRKDIHSWAKSVDIELIKDRHEMTSHSHKHNRHNQGVVSAILTISGEHVHVMDSGDRVVKLGEKFKVDKRAAMEILQVGGQGKNGADMAGMITWISDVEPGILWVLAPTRQNPSREAHSRAHARARTRECGFLRVSGTLRAFWGHARMLGVPEMRPYIDARMQVMLNEHTWRERASVSLDESL